MKRAKGLLLITALVTMALAFASSVYAADKAYDDLSVSQKTFYSNNANDLGVYPVIKDMKSTNDKIVDFVQKSYWNMPGYNERSFNRDKFLVSYKVEDSSSASRYAKVTVSIKALVISGNKAKDDAFVLTVYIDKEKNSEIATEADYDAAIKAAVEAAEAEEATEEGSEEAVEEIENEIVLRPNAEALGYVVNYNPDSNYVSVIGEKELLLKLNVNKYPLYTDVELEFAPTLKNGVLVVPTEFFTKILGAEVAVEDGAYVVVVEAEAAAE